MRNRTRIGILVQRVGHPRMQFFLFLVLAGVFVGLAVFTGLRANVELPEIPKFDVEAPVYAAPHRETGKYVMILPYEPPIEGFMVLGGTPRAQVDVTQAIDLWYPVREYIPQVNSVVGDLNREMSNANWLAFWALLLGAVTSAMGAIVSFLAFPGSGHAQRGRIESS